MPVTTAQRRARKNSNAQFVQDAVALGESEPRKKKRTASRKTISSMRKRFSHIEHRKELKPEQLNPIVAHVQAEYQEIRFNEKGSKEYVLAHYLVDDNKHPEFDGWPFMLTSSGNKFYLNPATGEVIEGDNNTY